VSKRSTEWKDKQWTLIAQLCASNYKELSGHRSNKSIRKRPRDQSITKQGVRRESWRWGICPWWWTGHCDSHPVYLCLNPNVPEFWCNVHTAHREAWLTVDCRVAWLLQGGTGQSNPWALVLQSCKSVMVGRGWGPEMGREGGKKASSSWQGICIILSLSPLLLPRKHGQS
jgi:hypothetical protein